FEFRGYYSQLPPFRIQCIRLVFRLPIWGLLHLICVPLAVAALIRIWTVPKVGAAEADFPTPLLAAMYLGWLLQAAFIQFQLDYHYVPTVLLALTLIIRQIGKSMRKQFGWPVLFMLVFFGMIRPNETRARLALWSQRFGAWGRCWTDSGTPELRNQLELNDMS